MFFNTSSNSFNRPRSTTQSDNLLEGQTDQTVPPYGGYSPSLHETFAQGYRTDHALMDTSGGAPSYSQSSYGVLASAESVSRQYGAADEWTHMAARGSVIMAPAKPVENRRKGGRKPKNDKLPPEEEEKRRVRRERNKVAAAKCRQRRVDHTNLLLQETQQLEDEGERIAEDVKRLQQMKDHLEHVLRAHKMHCKVDGMPGHHMSTGGGGIMGGHLMAMHGSHHKAGMNLGGASAACGVMHRQSSSSDSGQEQCSPGHGLLSL